MIITLERKIEDCLVSPLLDEFLERGWFSKLTTSRLEYEPRFKTPLGFLAIKATLRREATALETVELRKQLENGMVVAAKFDEEKVALHLDNSIAGRKDAEQNYLKVAFSKKNASLDHVKVGLVFQDDDKDCLFHEVGLETDKETQEIQFTYRNRSALRWWRLSFDTDTKVNVGSGTPTIQSDNIGQARLSEDLFLFVRGIDSNGDEIRNEISVGTYQRFKNGGGLFFQTKCYNPMEKNMRVENSFGIAGQLPFDNAMFAKLLWVGGNSNTIRAHLKYKLKDWGLSTSTQADYPLGNQKVQFGLKFSHEL